MKLNKKRLLPVLGLLLLALLLYACSGSEAPSAYQAGENAPELILLEPAEPPEEPAPEASAAAETPAGSPAEMPTEAPLDKDGFYTEKEDIALYLHLYGCLPPNFMTKGEARKLGWEGGSLEPFAPGMCIGGDHFGNYEGLLPEKSGRRYYECDVDTQGARSRGAKRIIFSDDGLIYYTDDHYESFVLLYGQE